MQYSRKCEIIEIDVLIYQKMIKNYDWINFRWNRYINIRKYYNTFHRLKIWRNKNFSLYNVVTHEFIANWIGNWRDLIIHDWQIWEIVLKQNCVVFQIADDKR